MKKIFLATLLAIASITAFAQEKKLPSVTVKTLDGKVFNTADIANDGKPIIISFFATWCKPCIKELTAINDVYEEWQEETGVKLIAISIDDSRTAANVAPFVKGKGWDYEFYQDVNQDFKRAMNVTNPPHTFILNGNGEIVWQHASYADGGEEEVIAEVRKLLVK